MEVREWLAELVRYMVDYMYTGTYAHRRLKQRSRTTYNEKAGCAILNTWSSIVRLAYICIISRVHKLIKARFKSAVW